MGGTFAPGVGPTAEVGFIVDSKGQAFNYLSIGNAVGVEASAGTGFIVVPQKNFNAKDWFGDGFGDSVNLPGVGIEYAQSMYNTNYRAGKVGVGVGLGGSENWTFTIILPIIPPEIWSRPGQPR